MEEFQYIGTSESTNGLPLCILMNFIVRFYKKEIAKREGGHTYAYMSWCQSMKAEMEVPKYLPRE